MICDQCHESVSAYRQRLQPDETWLTICRNCSTPKAALSVFNPYSEIVLEHVRDAADEPVRVTSLRQLREMEKEHHCRAVVANEREQDFDRPSDTKQPDMFEQMSKENKWLFPEVAESMIRDMRRSGEI